MADESPYSISPALFFRCLRFRQHRQQRTTMMRNTAKITPQMIITIVRVSSDVSVMVTPTIVEPSQSVSQPSRHAGCYHSCTPPLLPWSTSILVVSPRTRNCETRIGVSRSITITSDSHRPVHVGAREFVGSRVSRSCGCQVYQLVITPIRWILHQRPSAGELDTCRWRAF